MQSVRPKPVTYISNVAIPPPPDGASYLKVDAEENNNMLPRDMITRTT